MDKSTFYSELTARLKKQGLSDQYIERHLVQFNNFFEGKSESEIEKEIEKLGDLDKVAVRIKRMTDKIIAESEQAYAEEKTEFISPSDNNSAPSENDDVDDEISFSDEVIYKTSSEHEEHSTKSSSNDIMIIADEKDISAPHLDPVTIEKNRKKFWMIFAAVSPITLLVLLTTAALFAITFFLLAVIILLSVAVLAFVTAAGTLISVFGVIFGASQMFSNLPVGMYECGVAICVASVSLFSGILIYNFAVRLIPYAGKWLIVFMRYVAKKYRELYVYLKKECIGL